MLYSWGVMDRDEEFVENADVVGAYLGGVEGCCRSIAAHRVKRGQLERIYVVYEQLLVLTEVIQLNGERDE